MAQDEERVVGDYLGPYLLGPNDTPENGIYTGDARELAKAIPDASIDVAFCDPPYFVGFRYGSGQMDSEMRQIVPHFLVDEMARVASVVLITPGIVNLFHYPPPDWVYGWFKPGSTRRSMVLNGFNTWEPVLVYGRPKNRVYQDSSYLPSASNLNDKSANFHGCPKPINLLVELVEKFAPAHAVVLDPMVGSGTTAIACKMLGRRYLAFEIDPGVAQMARERVRNTQLPLFVPEPQQQSMELAL
jgi:hypothetical protein